MFKELIKILFVQIALITVIVIGVTYLGTGRTEGYFNNNNFYLYGSYNNNGSDNRAVQMSVNRASGGDGYSQTFNVQLDSTIDTMNISTTPLSYYGRNNRNGAAKTLVSYSTNQNPSITYGVPVNAMGNVTVYGDLVASKNFSTGKIKTSEVTLDNGTAIGAGTGNTAKHLVFKNGASQVSVSDTGLNANNINAANISISNPGGCIGRDQKVCFKDGIVESGKMNIADSTMNNASITTANLNWANINGGSVAGIRLGGKTETDEKGENPKIVQTIDADYILLKNNKYLGKDTGDVKIGNFTLVEDHPGRLSFFFKKKRVMELDATGSRSTDLYLYNQDNNENYTYMSSGTKAITKNEKNDARE